MNLSESNGWQKPVLQSKFRCVIIKIGIGPGFWKAALRIMPCFHQNRRSGPPFWGIDGTFHSRHQLC
jgi:hypothetical protein